MGPSK